MPFLLSQSFISAFLLQMHCRQDGAFHSSFALVWWCRAANEKMKTTRFISEWKKFNSVLSDGFVCTRHALFVYQASSILLCCRFPFDIGVWCAILFPFLPLSLSLFLRTWDPRPVLSGPSTGAYSPRLSSAGIFLDNMMENPPKKSQLHTHPTMARDEKITSELGTERLNRPGPISSTLSYSDKKMDPPPTEEISVVRVLLLSGRLK